MGGDDLETGGIVAGGFAVWVRSMRGRVRQENQDAWCVVTPEGSQWGPGPVEPEQTAQSTWQGGVVVAVFDGLGGHPNGGEAARAAAKALPSVVTHDASKQGVLQGLEQAVRPTGGATTAVVALVETEGDGHVLRVVSVGDSTAYQARRREVQQVNRRDRRGRHEVTDCLGGGPLEGHEEQPEFSGGLVLVTDGVDGVVPVEPWVRDLLTSKSVEVAGVLKRLWREIDAAGAPDNATVAVVRRAR